MKFDTEQVFYYIRRLLPCQKKLLGADDDEGCQTGVGRSRPGVGPEQGKSRVEAGTGQQQGRSRAGLELSRVEQKEGRS